MLYYLHSHSHMLCHCHSHILCHRNMPTPPPPSTVGSSNMVLNSYIPLKTL